MVVILCFSFSSVLIVSFVIFFPFWTLLFTLNFCLLCLAASFVHETSDVDVFIANYHRPKKITLQISLKSTICQIIEIAVFQFEWKSNKLPNGYQTTISSRTWKNAPTRRTYSIEKKRENKWFRSILCFFDLFYEFLSLKRTPLSWFQLILL